MEGDEIMFYPVEPRSAVWAYRRCGIPTASEFSRILTAGGKKSDQAEGYMHRLLAEQALGRPIENDVQTGYMTRGQDEEDAAISAFEFQTGIETSLGGFWTSESEDYGCSPDRMVGDDALLEMKIPAASTHIRYMLNSNLLAKEKHVQVQGELLTTGRQRAYLVSYHAELPTVVKIVERDEKYIDLLRIGLAVFCKEMMLLRADLEQKWGKLRGIIIPTEEKPAPVDFGEMGIAEEDVTAIWEASQR